MAMLATPCASANSRIRVGAASIASYGEMKRRPPEISASVRVGPSAEKQAN